MSRTSWATTYAFFGQCKPQSNPDDFRAVRDALTDYVSGCAGLSRDKLDVAEQKVSYELDNGRIEVVDLSSVGSWGYRLTIRSGEAYETREELCIRLRGGKVETSIRKEISASTPEIWKANRLPAVAQASDDIGFTKLFASAYRLTFNDGLDVIAPTGINADPKRAADWWRFINSGDRQLPLCLFLESKTEQRWSKDDANKAALLTHGLCHVRMMSEAVANAMMAVRPKPCTCSLFPGHVMIIPPHRGRHNPKEHIIEPLRTWVLRDKHPSMAKDPVTVGMALESTTSISDDLKYYLSQGAAVHVQPSDMIGFAHLERGIQLRERKQGPDPSVRLAELEAENERLRRELDAAKAEAREWNEEASKLSESQEGVIVNLTSKDDQIAALKAEVHKLSTLLWYEKPQVAAREIEIPDRYEVMGDWCAAQLANKVFLHPRVLRELGSAQYEDIGLVYQALLALGNEYRDMALAHGDDAKAKRAIWTNKLAELHLAYMPKDKASRDHSEYMIDYPLKSGHKVNIGAHLSRGKTRDPRHCLRIYFYWDAKAALVVVGSLPRHLPNAND